MHFGCLKSVVSRPKTLLKVNSADEGVGSRFIWCLGDGRSDKVGQLSWFVDCFCQFLCPRYEFPRGNQVDGLPRAPHLLIFIVFHCFSLLFIGFLLFSLLSTTFHCFSIAFPLLFHCFSIAFSLLFHCFFIAFPCSSLLFIAFPLLIHCFYIAFPLLSHCFSIAFP